MYVCMYVRIHSVRLSIRLSSTEVISIRLPPSIRIDLSKSVHLSRYTLLPMIFYIHEDRV